MILKNGKAAGERQCNWTVCFAYGMVVQLLDSSPFKGKHNKNKNIRECTEDNSD